MNNRYKTAAIGLLLLGLGGALVLGVHASEKEGQKNMALATNPLYKTECGSCHISYPPGLLPVRSWEKVMAELDKHFGENAEVNKETATALLAYLTEQAADRADNKRSKKVAAAIRSEESPMRITETRYFQHKHQEIPQRIRDNPKVGSFSRCERCHPGAEQGSFDEHELRIPGAGRWED
ncbi:MAG: diheme cytochrome c [Magnetococcales bacterium]|nr:diheme cytochrome c [Magnetococcales bacterium]